MAPQFVKPYVKSNKNDAADAEAICEAVARPNMRFVPVKNIEQQAVLALHRVRQGFVKARTAQANQIRGLLGEFGLVVPQGIAHIAKRVPELIEDASNELPGAFRMLIDRLLEHLKVLDQQVEEIEAQIKAWHRSSELSRKLEKIPGIGPLTASALVASDRRCEELRQRPAARGLAGPGAAAALQRRQANAAGHQQARRRLSANAADPRRALGDLSRRSARADDTSSWLVKLLDRRNKNVAAVALANKNARIVWALLAHDREFQADYACASRGRIATAGAAGNDINKTRRSHHRLLRRSEVMARQVRPWLAKPAPAEAPRVRVSDRGADQQIPSGTASSSSQQKSGCTGAIFTFVPSRTESLANRGRPCTQP